MNIYASLVFGDFLGYELGRRRLGASLVETYRVLTHFLLANPRI